MLCKVQTVTPKKEIAEALVPGATNDEINNLIEKLLGFSKEKQLISSNGICINDSFKDCLNEGYIAVNEDIDIKEGQLIEAYADIKIDLYKEA